jgi:hypothetical protein
MVGSPYWDNLAFRFAPDMSDWSVEVSTISQRALFLLLSLNLNWPERSKGMNGDPLTGIVSGEARAKLSARTMKISASIVTAFGSVIPTLDCRNLIYSKGVSCDRQHNVWFYRR